MDEVLNNTDSDDAGDSNNNNTANNTLGMQQQQHEHEQLYIPNRTRSNKHDSIPRQVDNITLQSPTNLRRKLKPSTDSAKTSTKNMTKNSTKQLGTALGALGQLVAGSSPKGGGSKNKNEFFPTYDVESYSDVQHMKLNSNPTNTNNPYNNDHNFDHDDEDTSLDHPTNTGAAQPARSRILTNTTSTNSSYDNSGNSIYNSNDHSSSGGQQYFTKLRRSYENIKGKLFSSTHSLRSSSSNYEGQNYDHQGDNDIDIEQDIRESQSILLASSGDSLDLDLLYTTAGHITGKRGTKKLSKMSKNSGTANKRAYTSAAVPGEPFSNKLLVGGGGPAYPSSSSSKNSTPRRAITTPRIR